MRRRAGRARSTMRDGELKAERRHRRGARRAGDGPQFQGLSRRDLRLGGLTNLVFKWAGMPADPARHGEYIDRARAEAAREAARAGVQPRSAAFRPGKRGQGHALRGGAET